MHGYKTSTNRLSLDAEYGLSQHMYSIYMLASSPGSPIFFNIPGTPSFLSCTLIKIREPGDEAIYMHSKGIANL